MKNANKKIAGSRTHDTLVEEMFEQIDVLRTLCIQFGRGEDHVYKPMGVCLRTMLLGSSGQEALYKAVLPDAVLARLLVFLYGQDGVGYAAGSFMRYLGIQDGGIVLSQLEPIAGDIVWRTEIGPLFHLASPPLPIALWIDQAFLRAEWSLASFIRAVANKDGGAHVDMNRQLRMMMDFGHVHRHLTNAIAAHVVSELGRQMSRKHPFFKRSIE